VPPDREPPDQPADEDPLATLEGAERHLDRLLRAMHRAMGEENHAAAGTAMLAVLEAIDKLPCQGLSEAEQQLLGRAVLAVITAFVQPAFLIHEDQAFAMLRFNILISNVVAGCLGTTTDPFLKLASGQRQGLFKTLVLYSARNHTDIDLTQALQLHPALTSQWLFQTWFVIHSGNCSPTVSRNLARFLAQMDHHILPAADMQELYWGCSYIDGGAERRGKELINSAIQRHLPIGFRQQPDPRRIVVLSDNWFEGHSVHRTQGPFVRALRADGGYHLTLVHSLRDAAELDTALFDEVIRLPVSDGHLDTSAIENNAFALALFVDVGMNLPSIVLANQRIAPVQVAMVGHSVSTFGGRIDYFLGGRLVDMPLLAEQNYSERLVLLPGFGAAHERPAYAPTGRRRHSADLIVNCPWNSPKISPRVLAALDEIGARSERRPHLRIFSSTSPMRMKGLSAFVEEIGRQVRHCSVEVFPYLEYTAYMAMLEEGDFTLDVFPFGGCNTVSDSLHLGKAVLVREGTRWFNRIGPAMVRVAGLEDLVASSDEEYVLKAVRLANDEAHRAEITSRVCGADLDATIYAREGIPEFLRFVAAVIADRQAFPGRDPILL